MRNCYASQKIKCKSCVEKLKNLNLQLLLLLWKKVLKFIKKNRTSKQVG